MAQNTDQSNGFMDTFLSKLKEQSFTIIVMVGIIWYQGKMMEERVAYWQKLYEEKESYIQQTTKEDKQILLDRENSIENIRSNSPKGTEKKGAIETIKKEADTKLSNAMSAEQWAKWLSFQEEQKKRKEAGQKNGANSESID